MRLVQQAGSWRSADDLGWRSEPDIEEQIRDLGGDPAIVAAYVVLLRAIFTEGTLRNVVPPGFWSH
jgi:hypothetical protein